jgi:hypothetical protein
LAALNVFISSLPGLMNFEVNGGLPLIHNTKPINILGFVSGNSKSARLAKPLNLPYR